MMKDHNGTIEEKVNDILKKKGLKGTVYAEVS